MSVLDAVPAAQVPAVLALGTNLGDREGTLRSAVAAIAVLDGVRLRAVSPVVETDPVGGPEQPDYLNAVLAVDTTLSPRGLLAGCHAVEAAHFRRRDVRWGPRTLDVDLISYDAVIAAGPDLELPHPRAHRRGFVLQPWLELEPEAVLPGAGPVAALAASLAGLLAGSAAGDGVRPFPALVLRLPMGSAR
jgi:2-amino-4-hydroxy-6-hydroxymethyldihydropteridine diphosphokinase